MQKEAFSFLVRQHAPQALRVLDMQDFHALRRGAALASLSPVTAARRSNMRHISGFSSQLLIIHLLGSAPGVIPCTRRT